MRNTKRVILLMATVATAVSVASGVALAAVIEGGPADNTLRGTEVADTIFGYDGNDTIYGMQGDDEIGGGNDRDILYGGDETKILDGNDRVLGHGGNDKLVGGPGADTLYGGLGDDAVYSGQDDEASVDDISGSDGDDRIFAVDGTDTIDTISCGIGRDEVRADPSDQVADGCEVVDVVRDVVLDLEGDVPAGQALGLAESLNATPEQLVAVYPVADTEYSAAHFDIDSSTTSAEVSQSMAGVLQDMKEQSQEASNGEAPPADVDTEADPVPASDIQTTIDELDAVIGTVQDNGAQIDEVVVQTATPVQQLEQDPAVQSAEVTPAVQDEPAELDQPNYNRDPDWVPKYGYIKTGQHNTGRRFVYQAFVWNDWRMGKFKNLRSNLTWEQEATYNVTDNKKYLGITVAAGSNLPEAYFDSIRGIVTSTYDYTMGTTNAQKLRANRIYATYIRTTQGSDNYEQAGANGQPGYRGSLGCRGQLGAICVRKERTDILLAVGNYHAPGSARYYSTDKDN